MLHVHVCRYGSWSLSSCSWQILQERFVFVVCAGTWYICVCVRETFSKLKFISCCMNVHVHVCRYGSWSLSSCSWQILQERFVVVCADVHVCMLVYVQERLSQSSSSSHVICTCMYMCADVEAGPSQAARGKSSKRGLSSSYGYVYACMCARETFSKLEFISCYMHVHVCRYGSWSLSSCSWQILQEERFVVVECAGVNVCIYVCVCERDFPKA